MNKNITSTLLIALALVGILSLTACGASTPEPTPTIDVAPIQTDAVSTFAAGLTQTAFLKPTETPTITPTVTATSASTPSLGTTVPPAGGIVPPASCYGLIFRQDVTIPDNTAMVPGQTFTKTWKVRNSGTCAWDSNFKLTSTGGDAMGATAKTLGQSVAPGAEIDISIPMTAPNKTGSVRGNWRMASAAGAFFGDELYVIINLASGTVTVTKTGTQATATKSVTPTASATTGIATATATATIADTPTETPTPTTAAP